MHLKKKSRKSRQQQNLCIDQVAALRRCTSLIIKTQ